MSSIKLSRFRVPLPLILRRLACFERTDRTALGDTDVGMRPIMLGVSLTISPVLELAKWMERRGWFGEVK